ncbi:MAG: acetylornithine deacetylase [Alphaproteobacteria bacterium]|nr:acetylornithine deacetylase [Alphaproteobacteria bacterium]
MSGPTDAVLDLIETLIGFDTVSHKSNLALIEFVADYLAGFGIEAELIRDGHEPKANLFATVGPADRPGVVLSGHTDVVPVEGQSWSADPFKIRRSDAKLFGRGTADMKSFIAVALAHVPAFQESHLKTPVHFAFSFDEEIGCVGVHSLLEKLAARPIRPLACIVGEPTGMKVVIAHKGKIAVRCTVTGREAHSSQAHKGANAVEAAARIIAHLSSMGARLREDGPFEADMDPPYATIQTGVVHGGEALNIVPGSCTFEFEIRFLPGQDAEFLLDEVRAFADAEILPGLKTIADETGIDWHRISLIAALDGSQDNPAAQLAKALTGANATTKVAFGTEAGLYSLIDIPTVVCGPGHVDQAHKPDEFISLDQVTQCEAFMTRLTERLASGFP